MNELVPLMVSPRNTIYATQLVEGSRCKCSELCTNPTPKFLQALQNYSPVTLPPPREQDL